MKSHWLGLVFVSFFMIFFVMKQHQPNTWLMGWDSLHPEFNYQLAFTRVLSGAWRESQGVGVVAVHSHMSELPRVVVLWTLSLFVPQNVVRWTYILGMLFLGVVGMYVLLVHILSRIRLHLGMKWVTLASLVGSLVYLCNLSTLHHFLVPFEMFVVLFGLLPWALWSASRYFGHASRGKLTTLLAIQFFLSSCAFAATLWVVYYGFFALVTWCLSRSKREWVKVQALTLLVNSYWLLPTMYGLLTTGSVVSGAKINQIFSPEAWLNHVAYGSPGSVIRLESFILQWLYYDFGSSSFKLVASQWLESVSWNYVTVALNLTAGLIGFGLLRWGYVVATTNRREIRRWSGLIAAVLALFIIMLVQLQPVGTAIAWMRESMPLLGELLRTPFTKVSILLQLGYAVLIGVALSWILEKVKFAIVRLFVICLAMSIVLFPFASWFMQGDLMGKVVVTDRPVEYQHLFEASKSMGNGRMVALPAANMWGWEYRDWRSWGYGDGYEGANFTQFGIVQPLLIRDFDRWSQYNEGFYQELSTALYSENTKNVKQVLEKYDVRYVLLDESILAPGQDKQILRIEETKALATQLSWKEQFHEGFLTVWETGVAVDNFFVSTPSTYTWMQGDTSKVREDGVWRDVGHYLSSESVSESDLKSAITYPFATLLREEVSDAVYGDGIVSIRSSLVATSDLVVPPWKVGDIVTISYKKGVPLPAYRVNGQDGPRFLGIEKPEAGKNYVVAQVSEGREWKEYLAEQKFSLQDTSIQIEVSGAPLLYDFARQGQGSIANCDVLKRGTASKEGGRYVADLRGASCDYLVMSELDTRLSYLMRIQGENKAGRSLKFFLYNVESKRNDIEYLLDEGVFDQTFSLLPWSWDSYYTLNIETRSFGQYSENKIQPVELYAFPLQQLASATLIDDLAKHQNNLEIVEVKKWGTWLYLIKVKGNGLLKLSQGYDEGWISVGLSHVKVDGWANGWMVPQSGVATIFYWPQLLEYLGFAFLGLTIVLVVRRRS